MLVGVVVGRGHPIAGVQRCGQTNAPLALGHIQRQGAVNLDFGIGVAAHPVNGVPAVQFAGAFVAAVVIKRLVVEAVRVNALSHVMHRRTRLGIRGLVRVAVVVLGGSVQPPQITHSASPLSRSGRNPDQ